MKKETKIRIVYTLLSVMILVIMLSFLTGCDGNKLPEDSKAALNEDVTYTKVMEASTSLYTFQDPKTRVWYYIGYHSGITPRYNADGSLYCTEIVN